MPASQLVEHLSRRLGPPGLHIGKAALNPFDGLHAFEKRLAAGARLSVVEPAMSFGDGAGQTKRAEFLANSISSEGWNKP